MIRIVEATDSNYSNRMNRIYGGNLKFTVMTKSNNEEIAELTSELDDDSKEFNDVMDSQAKEIDSAIRRYIPKGRYNIVKNNNITVDTTDDVLETWESDVETLSIKDGVDFVEFDDGTCGFVAYYNGHPLDKNNIRYVMSNESDLE